MKTTDKKEVQNDVKLLIFVDDDDKKKDRYVIILERTESGIKVKLCDQNKIAIENAAPFELPWNRVLKIKDVEVKD